MSYVSLSYAFFGFLHFAYYTKDFRDAFSTIVSPSNERSNFQSIKTLKNRLGNLAQEQIFFIQMTKLFITKIVHYNKRKATHYMPLFSGL